MTRNRVPRIVAIGLLLSILPLYGALYRSNSLGQQLQLLDSGSDTSSITYTLHVSYDPDGNEERLLSEDGSIIKRTNFVSDAEEAGAKIVTEIKYSPSGEILENIKTIFEQGLPQRIERQVTGIENKYITLHGYEEGHLVETKELVDGELHRLTTYYRGTDGMLAGLRVVALDEGQDTYFSREGDSTVFAETDQGTFSKVTFHPGNLVVKDVWSGEEPIVITDVSYDNVGRLVVQEVNEGQTIRKTYGPDGMLVHEESSSADGSTRTVSYIYDANGVLDQSVEIIEGDQLRRIEAWYRNGVVQTKTEWIDGQPVTATRFVEDGTSVVTLFEDGRPYVDITYAPDGKRVLSLEYRKER